MSTLTLTTATELIESGTLRLVTSDVFDTLVWRPVARPDNLFRTVARRLHEAGLLPATVAPAVFAHGRAEAERLARVRTRRELDTLECTIEEIWDEMPTAWFGEGAERSEALAAAIDIEAEVEAANLKPYPETWKLLARARDLGCDVVLVSDIYWPAARLHKILTAAGCDLDGLGLMASADHRRNKWDGLLDDVIAEHVGTAASTALHLGDNPISDVAVAQRAGAHVVHVDIDVDDDTVTNAHVPWVRHSETHSSDGGRSGIIRATYVAHPDTATTPSYQFGVAVAGPVMAGFANWIAQRSAELGATNVHYLLREGGRIAELVDVVVPAEQRPTPVLVAASRWAIMRAAVIDGRPVELERALLRRATLSPEHVANAFDLDVVAVRNVIGDALHPDQQSDAIEALADDEQLIERIMATSARLRTSVNRYLDRVLRIEDGPIVVSDIGWGGTIQEGLVAILREKGITNDVVGLYCLLSPPGERRVARGALLEGYLPGHDETDWARNSAQIVYRHPEFLERINTPAIGTLLGFDDDGTPISQADDHDVLAPSLLLAQRGVSDFCTQFAALVPDAERARWASREFGATMVWSLANVYDAPDPRLAAELGTWEHDDVAGTAAEALAAPELQRWFGAMSAVDAAKLTMQEVFWMPGAALAAGVDLIDPVARLRAGAEPDVVSPEAATGEARIAVFPVGSEVAAAETAGVPRLSPHGRLLMRLKAATPAPRVIRIDLGAVDLTGTIDDALVTIVDDVGTELLRIDGVSALRATGKWSSGRWVDDTTVAVRGGGYLIIPTPTLADHAGTVSIDAAIAFRTVPLGEQGRRNMLPEWKFTAERAAAKAVRVTRTAVKSARKRSAG